MARAKGRPPREKNNITGVIGERLKILRKKHGYTQATIALSIGGSQSSYSDWENDMQTPSADIFYRLAEFYNVSADYILGRTDIETTSSDIKTVCETTGLSEKAVQSLISIGKDYPGLSSQVISSAHFVDLIRTFWELTELAGLVDYMTEEIKSNSARAETEDHIDDLIRSLKYERYAFAEICVKILNDIHDIDKTISEAEKACSTFSSVNRLDMLTEED